MAARPWSHAWWPLAPLWEAFSGTCLQIAEIAEKQLAGEDFSEEDNELLGSLGRLLTEFHLNEYGEGSVPGADDAMRVADIVEDPRPGRREVFEVGVGRPRIIYVLYPWKGET